MKNIKYISILSLLLFLKSMSIFGQEIPAFEYDNLYRLIQVTNSDGSITSYQYDAVGNRMRKIISVGVTLPAVETTVANTITSNSAVVGGSVISSGGATVNERGIYWGTSSNPQTTGTKLQIGSGIGTFSAALTGLVAETNYYIKAYAINSEGTAYGEERQFMTLTSPPDLFTLNLQTNPINGGLVTGAGDYEAGTQISLQATANQGYIFINWTNQNGNIISETGTFNYTMPAENVTLYANFSDGLNYTLSGKLFNDLNTNGVYDPAEDALLSAINEWEVHLDGPASMSIVPNTDGTYTFTNIPAGDYSIYLTVPDHWTVINPFMDGVHHITLENGINQESINFACFFLQRDNSDMEVISFPNGQNTGDNTLVPMAPGAPQQSPPINVNNLPPNSIHLEVSATGYQPDTIYIYKDYITQLAVTSVDAYTHVFMFDDNELSAVAVGVSPYETRMITFKTYDLVPGQYYDFRCDVPGHAGRGEAGTMYILDGLNSDLIVQTSQVTDIGATDAIVGGNAISSGGFNISERGVYWGISPNPETTGTKLQIGSGSGGFSAALTELLPVTKYYVKAYATNNEGTNYGEELQFLTIDNDYCLPDWIPIPNQQFNMQVLAQIMIDDVVSTNPNDVLGAFVGDECRGVANPIEGTGLVFLSISSNQTSGEQVELKIWNSTLCEFCEAGPGFNFENLGEIGTYDNPMQVGCITDVDLTLSFGQGYTWFSENLAPEDAHPNMLFDGLSACNNDRLIGQSSFSVYFNGTWNGTITAMNPSYSYRMKLCEAQEFTATAPPAEIASIPMNAGYTWLGYLPQSCLPINEALANIDPTPTANDRLIGQSSFALYTGSNWIGSLTTLCPGGGYVIKLTNASSLLYPQASANSSMSKAMGSELDSPTKVYPAKNLQHSMTILGQLELASGHFSNNPNDRVYAYINDQCVGMANPMEVENSLIFMSVGENSDEAQEVSFKIWLDDEQQLYDARETIAFAPLKGEGVIDSPFKFTINKPAGLETDWFIGEPYPNPFSEETIIPYTIKESTTVSATVYNSTGQQLYHWKQYVEQTGNHQIHIPKGQLSSGIYNVKILISNSNQLHQTSKIIIVM